MKHVLLALSAFIALPALADEMLAVSGKDSVRLTQGACPAAIQALIQPDMRSRFRGAVAMVNGVQFKPCWALLPDGRIALQYEDGDGALLPLAQFQRVPDA